MEIETPAERTPIADFATFWPFYVSQHSRPGTRALHFTGTSVGLVLLASALVTRRPALFLGALVSGYAFAWFGHFFVEKNRPATFEYPLWSLRGDLQMYGKMWRREMEDEVKRILGS